MTCLSLVLVILFVHSIVAQTTIYISPFGLPTNSGLTPQSPLQTLGEAVAVIGPYANGHIIVAPGKYMWGSTIIVQALDLAITCSSPTRGSCRFLMSSGGVTPCISVSAAYNINVTLANVDVHGCGVFAQLSTNNVAVVQFNVFGGSITGSTAAFSFGAQSGGAFAVIVDGVSIDAGQALIAATASVAQISFTNVRVLDSYVPTGPFIDASNVFQGVSIAVANITVANVAFPSQFIAFGLASANITNVKVQNVSFVGALVSAARLMSLYQFSANKLYGTGIGAAVLLATPSSASLSGNFTSITQSNVPAFVVDNASSMWFTNSQFSQINTRNASGGAFVCNNGQLALDSVLLSGNSAASAAAGFCGWACSFTSSNILENANHEQSSKGDCIFSEQ